jgi:hypothetical protein
MIAITALTLLSTLSVVFYFRFLIAICKEGRRQRICHLVRLRFDSHEHEATVDSNLKDSILRAA